MSDWTAEQIAQRIEDLSLVNDRQLQEVWSALGRRDVPVDEFLQQMLRRDFLTNFQIERLLKGERGGFYYGPYKVLYRVNAGSFARVYRAVHKDSAKVVALKVLRRRYSDDKNFVEQFLREGERGRSLRHPNIVPIIEAHSQGTNHFFVMEFVEGGNLRDLLRIRKKLPPALALQLMIDVANGLSYAFQKGFCHRDLKLTNILVSSRMQARLIDFGLAAADETRVEDDDVENPRTIDYAGLERCTGVRKDDLRSDIYFCGCILYHLLSGEAPLAETRDRVQRLSRQRFFEVVPLRKRDPSVPRVVAAVVNKAMELDPEKRYQTPGQLLLDLKLAADRLQRDDRDEAGEADEENELEADNLASQSERERMAAQLIPMSERRAVMFVESSTRVQDLVREGLKSFGYRVLVLSDPERALGRFDESERPAQAVVFSAGHLGRAACEAFEQFVGGEHTRQIPVVLWLGERQRWKCPVPLAEHQVVSSIVKLRELRELLARLVPVWPVGSGPVDEQQATVASESVASESVTSESAPNESAPGE